MYREPVLSIRHVGYQLARTPALIVPIHGPRSMSMVADRDAIYPEICVVSPDPDDSSLLPSPWENRKYHTQLSSKPRIVPASEDKLWQRVADKLNLVNDRPLALQANHVEARGYDFLQVHIPCGGLDTPME